MARHVLFRGTSPNDGTGEQLYGATLFLNDMFEELYALQSDTINAGAVVYAAATSEARIQLAINDAVLLGKSRVFIPTQYLPFDATLVTFNAAVQMVREGGDYSIYDIWAYGADPTGVLSAVGSAAALYGAVPAGVTVVWPSGTYKLHITTNGVPLVTIPQDNIVTRFDPGAVLRMTAAGAITTKLQETNQYLFTGVGRSGLQFSGGTFDGNRTASPDPAAGFFLGMQCSKIAITGMSFQDSSNAYGGLIQAEAWNGSTTSILRDWLIDNNKFYRCSWPTNVRNCWSDIKITNNYFEDGDLEAPQTGYSKLSDTAYSRSVRFTGYVNSTSASGPIGRAVISGNRFSRVAYAIEVWNQDATNGRNPDNAELISIQNNVILSLWGIGINSYRDSTITGNTWTRLKLSAAQISTYAGTVHSITDTSVFGVGIEARPGYGFTVTGNTLDGQWVSGESPDLTGSVSGLQIGNNGFNVRCQGEFGPNEIQRCFAGISAEDVQKSKVIGNHVVECRRAFDFTTGGTNSFGRSGNTMSGNTFVGLAAQASVNMVVIRGGWKLLHNDIMGDPAGFATGAPINIADTAAVTILKGNTVTNFLGAGILDGGLDSTYDDNTLDSSGSTSNGSIDFQRQNNKVVRMLKHTVLRCSAIFGWMNAAGSGESYIGGQVALIAFPGSGQNRSISGGTIADMAVEVVGLFAAAAPAAGPWSKGTTFKYAGPAAAGKAGAICTATGTPGTWKDYGVIDA